MIKVAVVQFNPKFGHVKENIDIVEFMIEKAKADIVVLPELFSTGYQFISRAEVEDIAEEIEGGYTTSRLALLSKRLDLAIVFGVAEKSKRVIYNSSVLVEKGEVIAVYRKTHLFFEEKRWFAPGNTGFSVQKVKGIKVGMIICFDWIFPEACRILALKGAQLIAHPANLVLPYCQEAMKTRCIENRIFAATANRIGTEARGEKKAFIFTGRSQIVAPDGKILLRMREKEEGIGVAEINPDLALDKSINRYNHILNDRRVEMYKEILEKKEKDVGQ